jgi:hypothetical protein
LKQKDNRVLDEGQSRPSANIKQRFISENLAISQIATLEAGREPGAYTTPKLLDFAFGYVLLVANGHGAQLR